MPPLSARPRQDAENKERPAKTQEQELKRAGVTHLLRAGDVVWDTAVGDEGNLGRLLWDGNYLIVSIPPCLFRARPRHTSDTHARALRTGPGLRVLPRA